MEVSTANPLPPPTSDKIAQPRQRNTPKDQDDPQEGLVGGTWSRWFAEIVKLIYQAPNRLVDPIAATALGVSVGTTLLSPGQTGSGLYRVSWYVRITQAATVNSSLTITINWTDHGQAMTTSGAAIVGNTVTTFQSDEVPLFYSDALTPISYSTAYVSVGATPMQYLLYVTTELMFQ